MKKMVKLPAMCICAAMLVSLAACQGDPSASSSAPQTNYISQTASAPDSTATAGSVTASPTPAVTQDTSVTDTPPVTPTDEPTQRPTSTATQQPTSSVPVQDPLAFSSDGAAKLLAEAQKVRTDNGVAALSGSQKMDDMAQAIAEAIYAAGKDYREAGDFSKLPDGTSMTDYLKSKGFSGRYTFSCWYHDYPSKGDTVSMLINRASASESHFIDRLVSGGYTSMGAACGVAAMGEYNEFTVVVMFLAK